MDNIAREILKYLGNKHTRVERKQGFMGNYYSSLIDTIYIAEKFENAKVPKGMENVNPKAAELIVVCHECIHSVQNKMLHILNIMFANFSMILAVICIFIALFSTSTLWLTIVSSALLLTSMVVRLMLEYGAINGSIKLAKEVVDKGLVADVFTEDIEQSIEYINKRKWSALIQMLLDKIVLLVIVILVYMV